MTSSLPRFARYCSTLFFLAILFIPFRSPSQTGNQLTSKHLDVLEWRLVGPFRGGRAGTVVGVKENPNLYYMGTAGGGVWKTMDGGSTWSCISDGFYGGSIGAVAVAESDPNVLYVGEGEQTRMGEREE